MNKIKTLKSGIKLKIDRVKFKNNIALGLATHDGENVVLFSKNFIDKKFNKFIKDGYELSYGSIEYLV